jgi:biotin transport system substrate-specific component
MNNKKLKIIILGGLFVALTAIGAWISIPIGEIPVTLQIFFVLLSGFILGPKYGFWSQLTYIILGAIGFPVFAGFAGGFSVLLSPVGGYLIAFPFAAFCAGKCINIKHKNLRIILSNTLPITIIYTFGVFGLLFFVKSITRAITVGVLPFIAIDLSKSIISYVIAIKIISLTKFNNMLNINKGE